MTPYIPEDKILEVKEAASLEEVVGQYVKLQARGRHLVGLCPFHPDTTPSFTVSPERGLYHCYGCGAGGSVFSFLMQYHRLSFPEAVEELARRYGIPLTYKDLGPEGARRSRQRQSWYDLHKLAAEFYRATLDSPAGRAGRDYLAKRRLTPEVIDAFQLGCAPEEWDALHRHLQSRGVSLELAQEVGLLIARPSGGYYDRFRDRIMFPIQDRQGRVVAFGGRAIGDGQPKYLNSPESPLYSKGRLLYGLPQASQALRHHDLAILVEGYLDLLALRVHGIAPVLATLGTALTREQVRLLKNLVSRVVLVFDGDAAGGQAMCRAFPLFAQEGLAVRVLPLPAGMDPDNYAHAHGVELFRSPWEGAQSWFAYLLEGLVQTHGLEIEGRVRIIEALRPFVHTISDPVEKGLWLRFTAERLGVEEADLRRSLTSPAPAAALRLAAADKGLAVNLERNVLRFILQHPSLLSLEELEDWHREFQNMELRRIMGLIVETYRQFGDLDYGLLIHRVEEEEIRQQICALALAEAGGSSAPVELLADDWRRVLRMRKLKKAQQELKEKLAEAVRQGGQDLPVLLSQRQEIDRQLEALKMQSVGQGEIG